MRTKDQILLEELYAQMLEEAMNEKKIEMLKKLVPDTIEDKAAYIEQVADLYDPTKNKEYIRWILDRLRDGSIRGEEDADQTREVLTLFSNKKALLPPDERDILSKKPMFKSVGALAERLAQIENVKSKGQMKREGSLEFFNSYGSKDGKNLLGSLNNLDLYAITDYHIADLFFRGGDEIDSIKFRDEEEKERYKQAAGFVTKVNGKEDKKTLLVSHVAWCVRNENYWNSYKPSIYYLIIDKSSENQDPWKRKILFHVGSNQYKNIHDNETPPTPEQLELIYNSKWQAFVAKWDNGSESNSGQTFIQKITKEWAKMGFEIGEDMLTIICKNPKTAYEIAKADMENGKKPNPIAIEGLAANTATARDFCFWVLENNKEVDPKILHIALQGISSTDSVRMEKALHDRDMPIDPVIYDNIAKWADDSVDYIKNLLFDRDMTLDQVEPRFLESVLSDPHPTYALSKALVETNTPIPQEFIEKMAEGAHICYQFAHFWFISAKKDISEIDPKILDGIKQDPTASKDFVKMLIDKGIKVGQIDSSLFDSIANDSSEAYTLAKVLTKKNQEIPPQIKKAARDI